MDLTSYYRGTVLLSLVDSHQGNEVLGWRHYETLEEDEFAIGQNIDFMVCISSAYKSLN